MGFRLGIAAVLTLCLTACIGGDYDATKNPNEDSNWILRDGGIDIVTRTFHQIPAGTSLPENEPRPDAVCTSLDLDGDGTSTDSKKTVLTFETDPNKGIYSVYVYIANSDCSAGQPDYIDQATFDYDVFTSHFYFNRIDAVMTDVGRIVKTQGAADLLTTEQACGTAVWSVSESLVSISSCDGTTENSVHFFQQDSQEKRKTIGEKVEGLYVYLGSYFTYKIGKEGQRPNSAEIAEYTGSDLTGDPLFVIME
jgi:hypothetical protein